MFDDFDTQIQIDELVPEEYEDWLRFCAGAYEEEDEDEDYCFEPGRPFVSMFELNP